jgi:hypothetical protein
MSKHFLDCHQAAACFGLSKRQFERNVQSGLIQIRTMWIRATGGHKRQRFYLREDVEAARKGRP